MNTDFKKFKGRINTLKLKLNNGISIEEKDVKEIKKHISRIKDKLRGYYI